MMHIAAFHKFMVKVAPFFDFSLRHTDRRLLPVIFSYIRLVTVV